MSRERYRDAALLLALGAALFLPGLASRDLWNPDEPRYAEVAREMRLSGDYLVPHFNGQLYTQKPPLLFWAMCLFAAIRGTLDEIAVRLPVALSAALCLPLIHGIGARWFSRRAGLLAALLFGTSVTVMLQARSAQIDMLLVLWVTLAMFFWVRAFTEGRPELYPLFFLAAGIATVAKGPVGLLPPLLSILAFCCVGGEQAQLKRMRLGRGLALWALVVLLWLVPAGLRGGSTYLEAILWKQNLTRFANPWGHRQPWYYYLTLLPTALAPWFAFVPPALLYGWRRWRDDPYRRGFLFAASWVVVTVVFFSLSAGKRTVYIMTCYPALALLVGAFADRLASDARARRAWLMWPFAILAVVLGTLAALLPWGIARRPELDVLGTSFPLLSSVTVGAVALACLVATVLAARRQVIAAMGCAVTTVGAAGLVIVLQLLPPFDALKSARELSRLLSSLAQPGEPYAVYPRIDAAFVFYTRRFAVDLDGEAALRAFAARPGRVWLLAERDDLAHLAPALPLIEVARDRDPYQGHLLLTSPPWPRNPRPGEP